MCLACDRSIKYCIRYLPFEIKIMIPKGEIIFPLGLPLGLSKFNVIFSKDPTGITIPIIKLYASFV